MKQKVNILTVYIIDKLKGQIIAYNIYVPLYNDKLL